MSDTDPLVPDQPSRAGDDPSARRRRGRLLAVVAALAVVAVAAGAAVLVLRDDRSYPDEWDPQVQPFVDVVEKERGLTFEHPVEIRFLGDAAFEKSVRADRADLTKEERADIDDSGAIFRALGLIAGDVDLFDAVNDATGFGTLAYYSFDDRTITVRGKRLTLASQATLVHELTHALQDQRFGIGERVEELADEAADGEPTTEGDALDAIIEGDAERVAQLYRDSLSAADQAALEKAETEANTGALDQLDAVPKVIQTLLGAPYALGQSLAQTVAARGTDDLDALFTEPPPDDSVLLDPLKALDDLDEPADVDVPSLGAGEKKFDSGQVGSLVTYLVLAERIPVLDALAAADAWTGDAYVAFRRDDVPCVRVAYAAGSSAGSARIASAFDGWVGAAPGSAATVERDGDRVVLESCDPGEGAELVNDASTEALELLATRSYVASSAVGAGASADTARCYSRAVLDEFSYEELTDETFGQDDPAVAQTFADLAKQCAAG